MENLKVIFKALCVSVLVLGLASCGDSDDNGNKTVSFPTTTYVCESDREAAKITIVLEQDPSFEDELARVEVVSPGLKLEMDLLLGVRYRSTYEIRQALAYRNGFDTGNRADLVVASDPLEAPEVMVLDLYGSGNSPQVQVLSRSLRRAIRRGLAFDRNDFREDSEDSRPARGTDSSAMTLNCSQI